MNKIVGVFRRTTSFSGSMERGYKYDDTELREMIANNLIEANNYTDEKIDDYEEKDPTVRALNNIEIENIFDF